MINNNTNKLEIKIQHGDQLLLTNIGDALFITSYKLYGFISTLTILVL